jgi:hypothetical protein
MGEVGETQVSVLLGVLRVKPYGTQLAAIGAEERSHAAKPAHCVAGADCGDTTDQ